MGKDPELKDAKGIAICNFSVATSKQWTDESGEKKETTTWHDVVAFRKTAEIAGKYLTKGRQVLVEGELQTRSWDDKETGKKRYKTEIIANNIQFIGDGKGKTEDPSANSGSGGTPPVSDDSIPF